MPTTGRGLYRPASVKCFGCQLQLKESAPWVSLPQTTRLRLTDKLCKTCKDPDQPPLRIPRNRVLGVKFGTKLKSQVGGASKIEPWTWSTPAYFYTNNSTAIMKGERGQAQCCSVLVLRDPCDGNGMFVPGAEAPIPKRCFEDDHLLLRYDTSIRQFIIKTSDEGAADIMYL